MNPEPIRKTAVSAVGQGRLAEPRVFSASGLLVNTVVGRDEPYHHPAKNAVAQGKLCWRKRSQSRSLPASTLAQGSDSLGKERAAPGVDHLETYTYSST